MVGCSQKQTDNRIAEFERILGDQQAKSVNSLISDFEVNLGKIYPDLPTEKAYRKYLDEMISDSTKNWDKFKFQSNQTNSEFHKSGLWDEIYTKDSVYGLQINQAGKYMQALYAVKNSDSLINRYWDKRQAAGMMKNEFVVRGILSSDPDFSDYFHKRIVVLEFSF
tara:strand:- start:85 stop:582 length:498 start_codon:yes stop_codon:yes gene_type:complete